MGKSGPEGKSFQIPKQLVWEAYKRVKAKKGAAGVDHVSMGEFEKDLRGNLYKIWNRMSSGTYFPPPVKAVEIPKSHGGTRILGVPTVGDRIAQTVVALQLEARTESIFHSDSYGYRPGKSAHDALAKCRQRCWEGNWLVDLDIEKFFDSLDHDLVVRTVEANTDQKWVLLYVKRWLEAPLQRPDGTVAGRTMGTPQGSALSPLLANLFMHYAPVIWRRQRASATAGDGPGLPVSPSVADGLSGGPPPRRQPTRALIPLRPLVDAALALPVTDAYARARPAATPSLIFVTPDNVGGGAVFLGGPQGRGGG